MLLRSCLRSFVLRCPSLCIFRARRPVRKFSSGTIVPLALMVLPHSRSHPEMSSVMRALVGKHDRPGLLHELPHLLGRPLAEDPARVAVGAMPCQRVVEAHGVIEVREAERVEAPDVPGRVAEDHVVINRAGARGAHGLDEAVLETRVPVPDVELRLVLVH